MRDYAIKIEVGGNVFRYATDRVDVEEVVGGQIVSMPYIPMSISVDPPTASISLEGLPQVPNFSTDIADAFGDLRSEIERGEFERVKCTVYTLEGGTVIGSPAIGYMSAPSFDESKISFDVRMEEDGADGEFLKVFSHNSFQYTNIVTPISVNVEPNWEFHDTTPWTVEAYSIVGGVVRNGVAAGASQIDVLIDPDDPYLAAGGSANEVFVPDDSAAVVGESNWSNTTRAALQFEVSTDRIYDTEGTAGGSFTNWLNAGYIQVVGSKFNDGVYDVVTTGVTGGGIRYIEVGSLLNGLAADETVSGGVRIYPGTVSTRFQDGSVTPGEIVLGESALWVEMNGSVMTSKTELVKYSGTPTTVSSGGHSYVRLTGIGVGSASTHPIRWNHPVNAGVQGANSTQDRLIIALNGYTPLVDDNQPATVGFVHVEGDNKPHPTEWGYLIQNEDGTPASNTRVLRNFRVCQRFSTQSYAGVNTGVIGGATVLKINNFRLNSECVYASPSVWNAHGHRLVRRDLGSAVKLADYYWTVGRMELPLINSPDIELAGSGAANPGIAGMNLDGRLRGRRVDMLQSQSDPVRLYRSAANQEDPAQFQSESLALTNLGERFAVVKSSEYASSAKTETIYFQTPEYSMALLDEGYVSGEDVEDLGVSGASVPNPDDLPYTNLFRYNVDYGTRSEQAAGDLGYANAVDYFMSQKYRIVFDEVPQNSDSVGKYFPIVYGAVRRVPLLQVISNKVLKEDKATAGDDLYVYACHSCFSRDPADFDIEILTSQGEEYEAAVSRTQGLPAALNRDKAQSPFPKIAYNHYSYDSSGNLNGGQVLYSPYHLTEIKESLAGDRYYGIRLRGSEWDPNVGSLDKRFPIRHGVGSTKLYASFSGKRGSTGSFLQHPVDIIYDYVASFGRFPYTQDSFDADNMNTVKSVTRKLKAAVFLDQPMKTGEFIDKLCKQTGLLWYPTTSGKIMFSVINMSDETNLRNDKPIAEQLNLIQAVKGKDAGNEVAYTRVVYKFRKNWATGGYDSVIDLNSKNNRYCAAASRALGSKREFIVEADWVNDAGVAASVANLHASVMARSRIEYQMEVLRMDGIQFEPGDRVPVTYTPLGLSATPMVIQSVKENDFTTSITAVRFV